MSSPVQDVCPGCDAQIPEACVRCRECGAFLRADTEELASKLASGTTRPEWLVQHDGHQFGPFTLDDLRSAFTSNPSLIPSGAVVWRYGMKSWFPAHAARELWVETDAVGSGC